MKLWNFVESNPEKAEENNYFIIQKEIFFDFDHKSGAVGLAFPNKEKLT